MTCKYGHTEFYKSGKCILCRRAANARYQKRHPEKVNAMHRAYKAKNSQKVRDYGRRFEYLHDFGITIEDYNKMFDEQKGYCAICQRHQSTFKRRLAIDHDHLTGKVRGLLCDPCNRGMGMLKEHNLQRAITYLNKSKVVI